MTIPFHSLIGAMSVAAAFVVMPVAGLAETIPTEEPAPALLFSGFGAPALEELPLEVGDDSNVFAPLPPLEITDLGTSVVATDIETVQASRTITTNAWSIGVFR